VGDDFSGREGGRHGAFIERWNGRRWRVVAAPIPRGAILWSVSASGAQDAWALGQTDDGGQLIERWDGARWRVAPALHPPAPILFGVAARTRHDAWAVGVRSRGGGGETLVEHWDGTRWMVVPSPSPSAAPGRRPYAILRAVTAISPTDVWAAGYSGGVRSPVTRTLIEHWDGRRWTIVPSPNVRSSRGVINNILFAISGSRRDDVWAVGSWGSVPGGYAGRGDHALALHWDGRSWSRSTTPAVAQRSLFLGVVMRGRRTLSSRPRRAARSAGGTSSAERSTPPTLPRSRRSGSRPIARSQSCTTAATPSVRCSSPKAATSTRSSG
jgi:hypothetical protein